MVFVRVQALTCRQIDSRVIINSVTAPKGRCRDYQARHLTTRKAFTGVMIGLGLIFMGFYIWDIESFNYTSAVFAYCWTWNVSTLYFIVSISLHAKKNKIGPQTLGPKLFHGEKKSMPTPVVPWTLCRSFALILFQIAFDISWGAIVAYGFYFFHQVVDIGEVAVMGIAFIVAPLLLTLDLCLSQMVFVPLHFVFPIAFLFLWVLVLWAYTTVCEVLGDCGSYLNATSCWCSRSAVNSSDIVQCYNASVGFCKWSELGKCGWLYNPNPYERFTQEDLDLLEPRVECSYPSSLALELALAENGSYAQAAMCGIVVFMHCFGIILTCIREAICKTTMKPIPAAHRCHILPDPPVDLRFIDESGDVPTE